MQSHPATSLEKDLQDLTGSDFPSVRRRAAYRLGQLPSTTEGIVRTVGPGFYRNSRLPRRLHLLHFCWQGMIMSLLLSRKFLVPLLVFILLDLLAVGAGMGVPIFAILFGFPVGWFAPRVLADTAPNVRTLLHNCMVTALLTSVFTFLLMLLIWGPIAGMLFDPAADVAHFGIPMILYEPVASFIGWIVLMVFLSPFLQALATAFASSARLAWFPPKAVLQTS